MKKLLLSLLFLVLLSVTFSSCESDRSYSSKDIIGQWRMEYVEDLTNGEISYLEEVIQYWEFLSNGVLIIYEGNKEFGQYRWEIVDSKLILNGNFGDGYSILKLTKSKLDLEYNHNEVNKVFHFVKTNQ